MTYKIYKLSFFEDADYDPFSNGWVEVETITVSTIDEIVDYLKDKYDTNRDSWYEDCCFHLDSHDPKLVKCDLSSSTDNLMVKAMLLE